MKMCTKCRTDKETTGFHKDRTRKDGLKNWCKECMKEFYYMYRRTKRGKEAHRAESKRNRLKYPEREKTRQLTGSYIRSGRLIRKPCEVCSGLKVDAHHDDYSKPLNVRWLCRRHHIETHSVIKHIERNII